VVDLYYSASLLRLLEEYIDRQFSYLDPGKIWAVTLSEGEPGYSFRYFNTLEGWRKYNDTYHSETGFWLREGDLPAGESLVFNNWISEKWSLVFNHLYDYIKIRWPHILVFQSAEQWPGAPPVWIGGIDVSDVKADAFMGDLYYNEAYDNPFWLYEFVRQHKTSIPNKDYHIWLWGEEAWARGGLAGGFEYIRRNAWVAYLAGADAIGWFNWHNIHGNILDREDPLGKRLYEYTNRLNRNWRSYLHSSPGPRPW